MLMLSASDGPVFRTGGGTLIPVEANRARRRGFLHDVLGTHVPCPFEVDGARAGSLRSSRSRCG